MEITIKQLELNKLIFVPLTVSEAVLVKDKSASNSETVITLDEALDRKVENIVTLPGSGLNSVKNGTNIFISQLDVITANEVPENTKIKYNSKGIIVETAPVENLIVAVDGKAFVNYNGDDACKINFGQDFDIDNKNNITLKWTQL